MDAAHFDWDIVSTLLQISAQNLKCISKYVPIVVNSTIEINNKKAEQTKQDRYFDKTNEK